MTPEHEYENLCNKVEEFDPVAADYMRFEAPRLLGFRYTSNLSSCFTWAYSGQGLMFWMEIESELKRRSRKSSTLAAPSEPEFELWWQLERQQARDTREKVFALRNEIRAICGQPHYTKEQ